MKQILLYVSGYEESHPIYIKVYAYIDMCICVLREQMKTSIFTVKGREKTALGSIQKLFLFSLILSMYECTRELIVALEGSFF